MPIAVTANYDSQRGEDLRRGSRYGEARLIGIRLQRIDERCTPIDRQEKVCQCRLTAVDILVECLVRINPGRIARSFFDLDTHDAYVGRRRNGRYVPRREEDVPLDEDAVLAHEESHCKDIADAVRQAVKEALDRVEDALIAQCPCDRRGLCHDALRRMVDMRIRALGTSAYQDLLRDALRHSRDSETERRARRVTADHYADDSPEDEDPGEDDGDGDGKDQ